MLVCCLWEKRVSRVFDRNLVYYHHALTHRNIPVFVIIFYFWLKSQPLISPGLAYPAEIHYHYSLFSFHFIHYFDYQHSTLRPLTEFVHVCFCKQRDFLFVFSIAHILGKLVCHNGRLQSCVPLHLSSFSGQCHNNSICLPKICRNFPIPMLNL